MFNSINKHSKKICEKLRFTFYLKIFIYLIKRRYIWPELLLKTAWKKLKTDTRLFTWQLKELSNLVSIDHHFKNSLAEDVMKNLEVTLYSEWVQLNESLKIKNELNLPKWNKTNGLIVLSDKKLATALVEWLSTLDANFVVLLEDANFIWSKNVTLVNEVSEELDYGFDFVVCDNELPNLSRYFKKWVVPLAPKENYMSSILKEFNPMKSEGNSFLYDDENKWSIFYAITRYLENCKFPYDKKNLVKNVFEI